MTDECLPLDEWGQLHFWHTERGNPYTITGRKLRSGGEQPGQEGDEGDADEGDASARH